MSTTSRNVRIDDILAELRRQGWRVETSAKDGSLHKCFPPDKSRMMVSVSTRFADSGGVVQILRELRQQGFAWPPPPRLRAVESPEPEPRIASTPFAPRPSPATSSSPQCARDDGPSPDLAFLALKDARDYVTLAGSELRQAQSDVERAQEKLASATTAYRDALADLKAKKDVFDREFSAEEL